MQDLDLIRQLQVDGRASFRDLAEKTGISERLIKARIDDLRKHGAMEITIVADPRRLGYPSMALVGVRTDPKAEPREIAESFFEIPGVDYAVAVGGRFDVVAEVVARSDEELFDTTNLAIKRHEGVRDIELFPLLELRHQQLSWDAAQIERRSVRDETDHVLEPIDWAIIRTLSIDGRKSFLELARQLKVSESHIRSRFAKLLGNGLIKVQALTNPSLFGYKTVGWLCLRANGSERIEKVADRLATLPHVTYLALTAGRFQLFAEIVCKDKAELLSFVEHELSGGISGEILLCYDFLFRKISYGDEYPT